MTKNIFIPSFGGGIFIFLATVVPGFNIINCMCGAGVIGGGVLAVYLHRRAIGDELKISAGTGLSMGLISGFIGAVLSFAGLMIVIRFFSNFSINFSVDNYTSYFDDWMDVLDPMLFSRLTMAALFLISVVTSTLLAALGGLIGVSIFGQKSEPKSISIDDDPSTPVSGDGIVVEKDSHYSQN